MAGWSDFISILYVAVDDSRHTFEDHTLFSFFQFSYESNFVEKFHGSSRTFVISFRLIRDGNLMRDCLYKLDRQ